VDKRPPWLSNAHDELNAAVFAAYDWKPGLSDDEILARLLELNLSGAAGHAIPQAGEPARAPERAVTTKAPGEPS
jgi:hypothetical protein